MSTPHRKSMWKRRRTEDLKEDEIIIAIMGPTGSGKSTFVKAATGCEGEEIVGKGLQSCTTDIAIFDATWNLGGMEVKLVFVDTPGFDDTNKSDAEILNLIGDWLKKTYQRQIFLSGILYFHRIADNRFAGTPLKNLRMFEKLCGDNALGSITFTTTMWDEVDRNIGEARESELKTEYWGVMLDGGAHCARFTGTFDSVKAVVEPILLTNDRTLGAMHHAILQLQKEIVDEHKTIPETQAGKTLYSELEAHVEKQRLVLESLKDTMHGKRLSKKEMQDLMAEYQQTRAQVTKTLEDMEKLKIQSVGRFRKFVGNPLRFLKRS